MYKSAETIRPVIIVVIVLVGDLAVLILHVFGAAHILVEVIGALVKVIV